MRVWGRIYDEDGNYQWAKVETDPNGFNDAVYLTAFCQVLQLQTGESPFFADYGIPAQGSVETQIFPDLNVYLMQQRYSSFFAALKVTKVEAVNDKNANTPVYDIEVVTQDGAIISTKVGT